MLPAFRRLTDRILEHLGEDAVLRSVTPCVAAIERGVELTSVTGFDNTATYSEVTVLRTVATIDKMYSPKVGDALTLTESGENFKLDAKLHDNGYSVRFALLET